MTEDTENPKAEDNRGLTESAGGELVEGSGTTHPVTAYLAGLGIPEQSKHRSLIALRGVYLGLSASITLSRALLVSRSRMNQPW